MENFIVSARKYRPPIFANVVGQDAITRTLRNAIKTNKLAQAFLFTGPRGVGKTTCARILAKTINCHNVSDDNEPCNECESCVTFNNNASFNIYELDAASNNSVDDIRALVDQVRIPPQSGKYKVYIIDEVHMLSAAAFNAFLKTLEEPPAYAKFILATTEKHKIIPTILSRCQIFDFRRIGIQDIVNHLKSVAQQEGVEIEEKALHVIAVKADGGMRDALSTFDQLVSYSGNNVTYKKAIENLNVLDYDYYFRATDYMLNANLSEMLLTINEVIENGFDGQHFINGLASHFRNLLLCQDPKTQEMIEVSVDIRSEYSRQSKSCTIPFLMNGLDILSRCDLDYRISGNKRLLIELALMKIGSMGEIGSVATPAKITIKESQPKQQVSAPQQTVNQPVAKPKPVAKPISEKPKTTQTETKKPTPVVSASDPKSSYKSSTPKPMPKLSTGISLKGMKRMRSEEIEKQSAHGLKKDTDFSQQKLEEAWLAFAKPMQQSEPRYYNMISEKTPQKKDNFIIEFTVSNKLQAELFKEKRSDLIDYLQEKLKNNIFNITLSVLKTETDAKPYTSQGKFSSMAEKNPNIVTLKQQLGLSLE